jgi:hypothetical protein
LNLRYVRGFSFHEFIVNGPINHEEHTVSNGKAFQTKKDLEDPKKDSKLIYKLSDTPPVHLTLLFALQVKQLKVLYKWLFL